MLSVVIQCFSRVAPNDITIDLLSGTSLMVSDGDIICILKLSSCGFRSDDVLGEESDSSNSEN